MITFPRELRTKPPKVKCPKCQEHFLSGQGRIINGERVWVFADQCKRCAGRQKLQGTQHLAQAAINRRTGKGIIEGEIVSRSDQ